jgi:hypothetical protein
MRTQTFRLAVLWENSSPPTGIQQLIENLDTRFPTSKVSDVALTLSPGILALQFSLDFSLYGRTTMSQVESEVTKSGGRLVELLRIPEAKRDAFVAQFLLPPRGAPLAFKNLKDCVAPLQRHLAKQGRGIAPAEPGASVASAESWTPKMPNRRRASRFACKLPVQLQTDQGLIPGLATNISLTGIFVSTADRPPLQSEVSLRLQLPNGHWLQTKAQVVHLLEKALAGGVGLKFNPDPAFARDLERYFSPTQKAW